MSNYYGAQRAIANVPATTTDQMLVAPKTNPDGSGAVIRVIAGFFIAGGTATNVTLNSQKPGSIGSTAGSGSGSSAVAGSSTSGPTSDTAISPQIPAGINGGVCLPFMPPGWFETNPGDALTVTTGAGATVAVDVVYVVVPGAAK